MTGGALIGSPFGVGAVVMTLIALCLWRDHRFRLFCFLGTAILVITGAALLVNARIIPPSVPVEGQQTVNPFYTFARDYAVPQAIVLPLATADLRSLRLLGRPAFLAWVLAAIDTILGTAVATVLLGVLGYATGNYIGAGMAYLIQSITG